MKYRLLTKEQLESLHLEFAQFLATQKIDEASWKKMKEENSSIVAEELEIFSDMVWEDVLRKVAYIEHYSKETINLFKVTDTALHRIVVSCTKAIDLTSQEGYEWVLKNPTDEAVELFTGTKKYTKEKSLELFDLIEKGGQISKGELYQYFERIIS